MGKWIFKKKSTQKYFFCITSQGGLLDAGWNEEFLRIIVDTVTPKIVLHLWLLSCYKTTSKTTPEFIPHFSKDDMRFKTWESGRSEKRRGW